MLLEQHIIDQFDDLAKGLIAFGIEKDRRALRSHVKELQWDVIGDNCLELSFSLNAGCYATAVLREIAQV
jgi:tRNA pseudouridine13 synthase